MRIDEFRKNLNDNGVDIAVLYNTGSFEPNPNFFYFTGYSGYGCLAVPKKSKPFILAPKMEAERASKSSKIKVAVADKETFLESLASKIKKTGARARTVGIDKNSISLNQFIRIKKIFKNKKFHDISSMCQSLRKIKTSEEIEYIKKSCSYADKIIQECIKNFRYFRTESEAAAFLEFESKSMGLDLSFKPIVASGSNASIPHYEPKRTPIKKGFCVIDFGVKYNGYCSDITRTIYFGEPSGKEIEIYQLLLDVQQHLVEEAGSGKNCGELYDSANAALGKYKKYFTHGLGHGIGVEIHELPNLTSNSKDVLENGIPFTIEPGIYISGKLGIRIEDSVLFNNGKAEPLTKTTKDLLII